MTALLQAELIKLRTTRTFLALAGVAVGTSLLLTVLVSSHLLSEVAQSVDDVVIIANGKLRASGPLAEVLGGGDGAVTRVRSADDERLAAALREAGVAVDLQASGALIARGTPAAEVGQVAAAQGIALTELVAVSRSLEDAFFELTEAPGP